MTYPAMPPPPSYGNPPADPGSIPLRPLTVGDLLSGAMGVVRRHARLLCVVAAVIAAAGAAANVVILSATESLESFASGQWLTTWEDNVLSGTATGLPTEFYAAAVAAVAQSLITTTGALFLAGLAAACAGADAVGHPPSRGAVRDRIRGSLGTLTVVSALVAIGVLMGSFFFFVPGILVYVCFAVAPSAVVMERSSTGAAFSRARRLTRGHRGRIFGVTLLALLIAWVIGTIVSTVIVALTPGLSAVGALLLGDAVAIVVSAATTAWVAAVIALLYIDIRIRTENLAPALRQAAARNPQHPTR